MNPVNRNETVATKLAELDRDIETGNVHRSAIPMPIYSFLTKSAACFLLHRGRFHRRLATTASAFLSTG